MPISLSALNPPIPWAVPGARVHDHEGSAKRIDVSSGRVEATK
jgi:hypothetical protein